MKTIRLVAINLLVFLGLLVLIETANQAHALLRPSYDVLFLEPDRIVGWKEVPHFHWTWAKSDFRVPIETNPEGFRDVAREVPKRKGVRRVALLGDSFIEAIQVPLSKTAGQLLEARLNRSNGGESPNSSRWEVLNFGISGYSIGQYLLTWERYAQRYDPDVVVVFVSWLQARRTAAKYEFGAFRSTKKERLWIRPTFRLENGELIREPAADFDRFMRTQETLIQQDFGGGRVHRRVPPLLTVSFVRLFGSEIRQFFHPVDPLAPLPERGPTVDVPATIALNLRIIQELGHQIAAAGATFVVADASVYFEDDGTFSRPLAALCAREGFRYLPVSEDLLAANRRGIATHWKYDLHFNEAGNRILAEALSDWVDRHPPSLADANGPLR